MTKQEQILVNATNLFMEQGFGTVSMDNVARFAKVSKATVYAYFTSKEALFLASLDYNRKKQQIIYPKLPDNPAKNIEELEAHVFDYLSSTFNCFINDSECSFLRLIIAELNKFPKLYNMYYAKEETHTTSNLETYLIKYYKKHDPQKINQSYLIACQIIDMLRGQTTWNKLIKNSKRAQFFKDKNQIIDNIIQSAILLINQKLK
ncbi:MAG TPA: TetR/AcrR family transcriptional regulator [Aquella sp.]|nr:TetR/AcrR family transcriptional regulator [Aquella sp.]